MMAEFNPKLSTKGIILVAIPLFVQIVAAWYLSNLLADAERQSEQVEQSRQIINETLHLAAELYDAEMAMYEYLEFVNRYGTGNEYLAKAYDAKANLIPERVRSLRNLSAGNSKEEKIVENCSIPVLDVLRKLNKMKNRLNHGDLNPVFALGTIMAYGRSGLQTISSELKKLVEIEKADSVVYDQVVAKRKFARELIYYFLAVNIIFVLILLHYFNKGTIARLAVLMDNTRRLAGQKTLNPRLAGRDEMADLDRVFHDMADAMESAKKREQELMEVKKQIMAMVSHDLRSPLTSLQMTLGLLLQKQYGELSETGKARVEASDKSVQRLIRMINDLLDLEKLEAGKMELNLRDLPVQVIVLRAIEEVQELARAKGIRVDFEETDLEVKGDGDRLIQVLVNLLSNAIKFSPENSIVRIKQAAMNGQVELRVEDQGPGIPEEKKARVFERYRQLENRSRGGTGLGLAICKLIIQMHNGEIGVDACQDGGSSFWVRIPA